MSNEEQTASRKPTSRGTDGQAGVQSVDRAITVLEILAREGHAGVSDIAAEIGVHKSTAFRLLAALEERDLVEQNTERGKYQLAFGILRLASAIPTRIDMVRQAQPVLDALALQLDETINLAVLREHFAVNVQQARSSAAVISQNWVGQLTPLHATSSGKILLANLPDEQRDAILDKAGLPSLTPATITSRKKLLDQLEEVRTTGFATVVEELEVGLNAAAVPVRDHTGSVVGALSASGPAFRFNEARMADAEEALRAAGDRISYRMGSMA
ncbi:MULTISPECIES: IclR family transcriptional regulator [unclassified Nocardioides]|uniref:IclR family transcriptional regulator n=1 Tax=unclassified Nocardioides TaxID=2615069 RepID=UPI0007008A37|nr:MULTISPECIES: IclR family transcriptional regulator [unclassified Nocardioides]KRA37838.1 IclR family transcriptional regulator [Nocardioides sp. Root614]KRA91798.1 IclR family transcriptional regulator [Nocardioides sp. Root682]